MSELRGNVLWFTAGAVVVVIVTLAFLVSPLVAVAGGVAAAVTVWALFEGRGRYRGVAVLGGVGAVVLVPALHTPLPGWTGMAGGGLWMLVFGVFLPNRRRAGGWVPFILLAATVLVGVGGSLMIRPFPFVAIALLYLLPVALLGRGLVPEDARLVRNGVVALALIEALLCLAEFAVFRGDPFDDASGYHPVLSGFTRTEGTLGHPIVAGVAMLGGMVVLLAASMPGRWKFVGSAVLLVGIFTTGSSSVYIAALVAVVGPLVFVGRAASRVIKVSLLVAVGAWLLGHREIFEPVVNDVSGINSTHRLNSIQAIPNLLTLRPLAQGLVGSGWGSEETNYRLGFLKNDYFYTVDNMFATTMMAAGITGFLLIIAFIIASFVHASRAGRVALLPMVVMMLSFDVLQWASAGALFVVIVFTMRRPAGVRAEAERGNLPLDQIEPGPPLPDARTRVGAARTRVDLSPCRAR
ncbi:hypothetical protein [Curtobacterium sp. SL109]|uniref:hypothetical protein n=1 Tax=Curtobacterium sp. SL109 TaxID=2994662 RepID=UPI002273D9FC|nr:hypothetical protein [Curtobacterium sp. SL109]MCY1694131.1 hypothetical protein [Curtobacterium sp. SL109]